jgi:hypothetical protein
LQLGSETRSTKELQNEKRAQQRARFSFSTEASYRWLLSR